MSLMEEVDFTKEDRGRYRAPTFPQISGGALGGPELEAKIIEACGEKFRLRSLPMIHRHCDISFSHDLRGVISAMCVGHQLREFSNGHLTAWFPFDVYPKKIWLGPERTVEAEFEKDFVPRNEEAKYREMNYHRTSEDLKPSESEEMIDRLPGRKGRKQMFLDETKLEDLATSCANQEEIAAELGISVSYLQMRIGQSDELRRKFRAWREEYKTIKAEKESLNGDHSPKEETTTMHTTGTQPAAESVAEQIDSHIKKTTRTDIQGEPKYDLEKVERYAREGKSQREAAELLKTTVFVFKNALQHKTDKRVREAWDRGVWYFEKASGGKKPAKIGNPAWSRAKIDIDPDKLEQLAAKHGSQTKIYAALGVSLNTLRRRLDEDPELKKRYDAGTAAFQSENGVRGRNIREGSSIDIDPVKLRELAASGLTLRDAAEKLGVKPGKLNYVLYGSKKDGIPVSKVHADAWKEGSEIFKNSQKGEDPKPRKYTRKAAQPAPEPLAGRDSITIDETTTNAAIEEIADAFDKKYAGSEVTQGHETDRLNELIRHLADDEEYVAAQKPISDTELERSPDLDEAPTSHRVIKFGNGAKIAIGFDGNYFSLAPKERELLELLTDTFEGYENALKPKHEISFVVVVDTSKFDEALRNAKDKISEISELFPVDEEVKPPKKGVFARFWHWFTTGN